MAGRWSSSPTSLRPPPSWVRHCCLAATVLPAATGYPDDAAGSRVPGSEEPCLFPFPVYDTLRAKATVGSEEVDSVSEARRSLWLGRALGGAGVTAVWTRASGLAAPGHLGRHVSVGEAVTPSLRKEPTAPARNQIRGAPFRVLKRLSVKTEPSASLLLFCKPEAPNGHRSRLRPQTQHHERLRIAPVR